MPERTPEERERDRLAREAKRAAKQGRSAPQPPAAEPARPAEPEAPPAADPVVPAPPPVEDPARVAPPATGRDWRRAAGEPDPDPPLVRRVEQQDAPREAIHAHDEPLPDSVPPASAPPRRIPPPPDYEQPIGTTRRMPGRGGPRRPLPPRGPQPGGASRGRRRLRTLVLLLALALVTAAVWFAFSLFQPFGGGNGNGHRVAVVIPKGASLDDTARLLERDRVIGSAFFFKLRAKLDGRSGDIKAGRHDLQEEMGYGAALDALARNPAPPRTIRITIPEGRSRGEVAPTVRASGLRGSYLAATKRRPPKGYGAPKRATLEGFLFPATYELKPIATASELVADQLRAFRRNMATVDLRYARRKNLTAYDVVVIASMIEREAGIPQDRAKIAAVIYNRLKQGIPLGIDATLRYALHNWTRPLRVSELRSDTPYNTRVNLGLPPGPIGSPGLASLRAAAHPARVPYLYYVAKPCGNGASSFSSTDAQFQRDVAAYNRKRAALGGKSPTTCK